MIGFGGFGVAYLHCVYGAIAFLIALIFVDGLRSGWAFVGQSWSRYVLAFGISLVISPVILVVLTILIGLLGYHLSPPPK